VSAVPACLWKRDNYMENSIIWRSRTGSSGENRQLTKINSI
jgi:hypothetical protein